MAPFKKVSVQLFIVAHFLPNKWSLNWNMSIIEKYTMLTKKARTFDDNTFSDEEVINEQA